ncbi:MAG: HEPN domain-containing protein [Methanosarcinales archaeon]
MRNELMAITPDKWGLIERLGEGGLLNIEDVKAVVQDLANTRMTVAEEYFEAAKILLENNIHDRSVISRAYYGMYHAVRAVIYIRARLDVPEHKKLIKKFKKVLIRESKDYTSSTIVEDWRMRRNWYEYNPLVKPSENLCNQAVEDL